jgi:uncharacterized protein (DUF1697 family)
MPKYVAFLRAVNVGGHVVKMETLRTLFVKLGFSNVQTFVASGNVVFESAQRSVNRLEQTIEKRLADALGYTVTTFVRGFPELAALSEHPLVSGEAVEGGAGLYVVFVREKPTADVIRKLMALTTDAEDVRVHEHHVLWLVRGRFSDSPLSGPSLERALGVPATVRNSTTVRKVVQKFKTG